MSATIKQIKPAIDGSLLESTEELLPSESSASLESLLFGSLFSTLESVGERRVAPSFAY